MLKIATTYIVTHRTWLRYVVAILLVVAAAALRLWPLHVLETKVAWLTFYPAVMAAAIYGGLYAGLLSAICSCLILAFAWPILVDKPYIKDSVDLLGMIVFFLTCTMLSFVAESMRLANVRAKKAQDQAQTANQAKSKFLANMSHELRTPLNAILGYSELLQENLTLPQKQKDFVSIINRSGEHLLKLINEVLEISKIEANHTILEPENFSLIDFITDIKNMFQVKTDAKGLQFEISGTDQLPPYVFADQTKLRIILINILGNAVKFTKKGSVTARFSLKKTNSAMQQFMVEIEDTGPGVAAEEIDRLFQYFVQTESGRKSQSGTGLGLAISQDYIKMMGGNITVKSSVNVGTTFRFFVEVKEGSKPENFLSQKNRVFGLQAGQDIPRILVAEDNAENRNLLANILKITGFDVCDVANGEDAVKNFEQWQPSLIWMDIRMPVMDGLEATRLIRASRAGKSTKIVALSAHVLKEERQEIFDAGCDDFLAKPYRKNEIFAMMEKHLGLKYVYEQEEVTSVEDLQPQDEMLDLSSLNDCYYEALALAVANTNAMKIHDIAGQIRNEQPAVAQALQQCAYNFDYKSIQVALLHLKQES